MHIYFKSKSFASCDLISGFESNIISTDEATRTKLIWCYFIITNDSMILEIIVDIMLEIIVEIIFEITLEIIVEIIFEIILDMIVEIIFEIIF